MSSAPSPRGDAAPVPDPRSVPPGSSTSRAGVLILARSTVEWYAIVPLPSSGERNAPRAASPPWRSLPMVAATVAEIQRLVRCVAEADAGTAAIDAAIARTAGVRYFGWMRMERKTPASGLSVGASFDTTPATWRFAARAGG